MADAFDGRSRPVQFVSAALAWGLWGLGVLASMIPATVTLTVVRLIAPGVAVLAAWSAFVTDEPDAAVVSMLGGVLVAGLALLGPGVADAFVDGSSYGTERRVALRVPVGVAAGPVALSWAATAVGVVAGPLLLASEQWVAGGIAFVVGAAVVYLVVVRLHELSRRWLVFVPAGVVVHDPLLLTDAILFPRAGLERFGPATEGTDALDATGGALGLVLELRPADPIKVGLRRGRESEEHDDVTGLLVCPTRPGATLDIARDAKIPVA